MRFLILLFLLFVLTDARAQDLKSGGVLKPEQAILDIRHYTIALDVSPSEQTIEGYAEIDFNTTQPTSVLLFDLVHLLTVRKVWVNKKEQPFTHENDLIRISLSSVVAGWKGKSKNSVWR